jgi:hypothetical protein
MGHGAVKGTGHWLCRSFVVIAQSWRGSHGGTESTEGGEINDLSLYSLFSVTCRILNFGASFRIQLLTLPTQSYKDLAIPCDIA